MVAWARLAAATVALGLAAGHVAPVAAVPGSFVVTKTADTADGSCDDDCSLREAVIAANATPGDDVIELPAGTYVLTIKGSPSVNAAHGDLDVAAQQGTTTILGAGRDVTVIDASGLRLEPVPSPDRVFTVHFQAGLELDGVTVTGGYTQNVTSSDRDGGGIWNWNGSLTLTEALVEGNVAGENGGGIANHYGTATLTDTIVRGNDTDPPEYTTSSSGGGIFNAGTMAIAGSLIELNASDHGGGIANATVLDAYPAFVELTDSTVTANQGRRGGGIANLDEATATITGSVIALNLATRDSASFGSSNRGGGIYNASGGAMTITATTIEDNQVAATRAVHPVDAGGGGIANLLGTLEIRDSTVAGNDATCDQAVVGDPDLCGRGGGVVNAGGEATIVNSTISGNATTLLGTTHTPYLGGGGGGGLAHMPYRSGGTAWCPITIIDSVTITDNTADHGGGIDTRWETKTGLLYDIDAWEVAPNVYECPFLYVTNTILADNDAAFTAGTDDCWGDHTSDGHNLLGEGAGCVADGIADTTTADARLDPLADNGGPTLTHLPQRGSAAIDQGATDETHDQRGITRPVGAADDVGSVEAPVYPNDPPELDPIGDQVVAEGDTLEVGLTASDPDADPLHFTLSGAPAFASLTDHGDGTATLTLTPGFDDAGTYPGLEVEVSDWRDTDGETITVTVTNTITCAGLAATIVGTAANDVLIGGPGIDVIAGRAGDDVIDGGGGDDVICGGIGLDVIVGGPGNDLILGDAGRDTVDYSAASGPVSVNLQLRRATGAAGTDRIENVEDLIGSEFDDTLRGNAKRNVIFGGGGDDRIQGLGGNDDIFGQLGDDTLNGRRNDDLLDGGPGTDLAMFIHAPVGVVADLAGGVATGDGTDVLVAIEDLFGSRFGDTLHGDALANYIRGSKGGDLLYGRAGDDLLVGNTGTDWADGGTGTDVCRTEAHVACE